MVAPAVDTLKQSMAGLNEGVGGAAPGGEGEGGGNSLTIQNVNLYGVQDMNGLVDEIQRAARSKGLQFSPVM